VIRRLYIHSYKVFQNFELQLSSVPATLLIGKNGAGKTIIASALRLLQQIARSRNRARELLTSPHSPIAHQLSADAVSDRCRMIRQNLPI